MKRVQKNKLTITASSFLVTIYCILYATCSFAQGALELSLGDVTQLALENSLDIQIAKYDAYISRTSLGVEESIFDAFLNLGVSFDRDKKARTSTIFGQETKEHEFTLGLEKKLPTGTTLFLDTITTKSRNDSTYSTFNPYNEVKLELSVTQELGKNFFGLIDRSNIKITKIDIENSQLTSLDDIEKTVYKVQRSYWSFALKSKELDIAKDMLGQAQRLYDIYKDKLSLGLVEDSELLAIEALLYTRKSDVEVALLAKETEKNGLLFLINMGDFSQEIKTSDSLFYKETGQVSLYNELTQAIGYRRDYKRIKNKIKKNGINIIIKNNALWPQIDLEATFTRNNLHSERLEAWEDLAKNSNDEVFLKIALRVPLDNKKAKAEFQATTLKKQKLLLEFKKTERLILQELNDKVNKANTVAKQVTLYQHTLKIHKEKLGQQIKRMAYGRSDADTLVRYEEDLLNARLLLVYHFFKYRISLIELELAKNTLLANYWKEPL